MTRGAEKKTRGGPRGLWLVLHKWIGLVLGVWLACQAATGTLLVFWYEIEAAVAPELYRTGTPVAEVDYDGMVAKVASAYPDRRIAYLQRDMLAADEAFRFVLVKSGQLSSPFEDWEVFVNSSSGEILGSRPWLTFMRTVWLLHNGLLIEPYEDVLAVLGVALIISICTGIVLVAQKLQVQGGASLQIEWHNARRHTTAAHGYRRLCRRSARDDGYIGVSYRAARTCAIGDRTVCRGPAIKAFHDRYPQ